jgi:carbamoyltransferase
MTWVLGLNTYHADASACLLRDGKLVCAVEQERLNRVKHWGGFPDQAIAWCLAEAGIGLGDLAAVAINRDNRAARWRKLAYVARRRPGPALLLSKLRNRRSWASTEERLAAAFPGQRFAAAVVPVEHHLAHLASAYWASPFPEASVISIDGFGDFTSAAWARGSAGRLALEGRVYFPHSLGIFYEAATQFLGFPHYGDEYKVMGLAPYGQPSYRQALEQVLRLQDDGRYRLNLDYFQHHREDVAYQWRPDPEGGGMSGGRLWSAAWQALLGPARGRDAPLEQRHRDVACSVQAAFEDAAFNLIGRVQARHGMKQIALAGGCAFNSVMNGKLRRRLGFERVYVQAAAGDAGGALGAALVAWQRLSGQTPADVMSHAYWGPQYGEAELLAAIEQERSQWSAAGIGFERHDDPERLCARVAAAIDAGAVAGWFQGRVEWGPRALGNRSILADPRRPDMKELLNAKIKRRESFRPFAPSILAETVGEWFEEEDAVPFMMQVFQIRPEKRALIPAVTHVDGSGRLQSVTRETNPLYHRLIAAFAKRTGVPMLLNTSFNENEPIVCRPEEALDCFLRTKMDLLALGPFVLARGGFAQ